MQAIHTVIRRQEYYTRHFPARLATALRICRRHRGMEWKKRAAE